MSNVSEAVGEAVKVSPAVSVAGSMIAGIQLSDVVLVATLVYTLVQLLLLIPKIKAALSETFSGST